MPAVPKPERTPAQRGKASKRKGYRFETQVAKAVHGERVPLSGALGGKLSGDVVDWAGRRIECKSRAKGFRSLYEWLRIKPNTGVDNPESTLSVEQKKMKPPDYLVLGADNSPMLAVLPLKDFVELLMRKEETQ